MFVLTVAERGRSMKKEVLVYGGGGHIHTCRRPVSRLLSVQVLTTYCLGSTFPTYWLQSLGKLLSLLKFLFNLSEFTASHLYSGDNNRTNLMKVLEYQLR